MRELSAAAVKSVQSIGRPIPEELDPVRTCFQRDRDRIIHCKAFRRLKHKTQVFISPDHDHYRTRLTHTLEVSQIARTISRALRLNEDLTEAIALAHDLGHPPFGHAGETALDEVMGDYSPHAGFRHYEQSLRVVDVLENDGEGLNLTHEVRLGISHHSKGQRDLTEHEAAKTTSAEAAAVRFADRIAYVNHDLDDAIRAGAISLADIPSDALAVLGRSHSARISTMVGDIIEQSAGSSEVRMSSATREATDALKDFLFKHVYLGYLPVQPELRKARELVKAIFRFYADNPENLPPRHTPANTSTEFVIRSVCDYVAGMTDRFAIQRYQGLFVPRSWASVD